MNHLRKIGLASFFFPGAGSCQRCASSISGRLDSTNRGDRVVDLGLVLALLAFMQSRRGQSLDGMTKFLARARLALVTIGVLIFFLRAMIVG
jgi:hypothetical protein